ncbi:MAG: hypothetical protein JXA07_02230 [Spirochaetes bacterium]|nr:hypothetical protein [Spirochaetota bacterium]
MAFQRNHVRDAERLEIGLHVLRYKSVYGVITDLARKYLVSRWFIYYCYAQFLLVLELQKELAVSVVPRVGCYATLEERVLSLYLETEASISGMRRVLNQLFGQEVSSGRISEILTEYGSLLPSHETVTCRLKFVSDEIFVGGPILVTVEPLSAYLLSLEVVESRDKVTWGACWFELVDAETGRIERIVADLAKGLVGGLEEILGTRKAGTQIFQGDLFHLIMRLVAGITRAERKAYAAITQEYDALEKFERAKSERTLLKRLAAYETAHAQAEQWMQWVDDSRYLFRELQEILRIVDVRTGELRRRTDVLAEVETILVLFEQEIAEEKLRKGAGFLREHLDALLRYFDDVEDAAQVLERAIPDAAVRQDLFRLYALQQQRRVASGTRKRWLEAQWTGCHRSLLTRIAQADYERWSQRVEQTLDAIIRSSSVVENTNGRLRRFFDSARGQITQSRLNLLRFYLNHKPFERGRRQGYSPAQLFHGEQASSEHWLTLLRRVKEAERTATT